MTKKILIALAFVISFACSFEDVEQPVGCPRFKSGKRLIDIELVTGVEGRCVQHVIGFTTWTDELGLEEPPSSRCTFTVKESDDSTCTARSRIDCDDGSYAEQDVSLQLDSSGNTRAPGYVSIGLDGLELCLWEVVYYDPN